jgi:hypothetical protein
MKRNKKKKENILKIPDEKDWAGYEDDLDVIYAHDLFIGKSIEEATPHFQQNPVERMDELLFMPTIPFQYYVFAFVRYVMSDSAKNDPDAASGFLSLIEARLEKSPASVIAIMDDLLPCLDFISENQKHFDADEHIYGDFKERRHKILELCDNYI